jgi:hypothetical protein
MTTYRFEVFPVNGVPSLAEVTALAEDCECLNADFVITGDYFEISKAHNMAFRCAWVTSPTSVVVT